MLKDQLEPAIKKANESLDRHIWKLPKRLNSEGRYEQDSIRLVDASDAQLRSFYQHSLTMLKNTDPKFPGREVLLRTIKDQIVKVNAELFYREYSSEDTLNRETFLVEPIKQFIKENNLTASQVSHMVLRDVVVATAAVFAKIPVNNIIEAGEGRSGLYNRSYMTLTFLLNKGIRLSDEERELYADFTEKEIITKIKETLKLKDNNIPLNFNNNTGMSVKELAYMLPLKKKKYEELPLEILYLLRDKLLVYLKEDIEYHIGQWNERIGWLTAVAEDRGLKL